MFDCGSEKYENILWYILREEIFTVNQFHGFKMQNPRDFLSMKGSSIKDTSIKFSIAISNFIFIVVNILKIVYRSYKSFIPQVRVFF